MPEFDIDAELANLFKAEEEKASEAASLVRERSERVVSFQEYVMDVCASSDNFTVEEIISTPAATEGRVEEVYKNFNIREQLAGDLFQERCNEMENDLNYNEYDEAEELLECRREYQQELNLYVSDIEPDEEITLTTLGAMIPTGGEMDLFARKAYYCGPTIIKVAGVWRVVHSFSTLDDANEPDGLVYVFPPNIIACFRAE